MILYVLGILLSINLGKSDMLQGIVNEYREPIVPLKLVSGSELIVFDNEGYG